MLYSTQWRLKLNQDPGMKGSPRMSWNWIFNCFTPSVVIIKPFEKPKKKSESYLNSFTQTWRLILCRSDFSWCAQFCQPNSLAIFKIKYKPIYFFSFRSTALTIVDPCNTIQLWSNVIRVAYFLAYFTRNLSKNTCLLVPIPIPVDPLLTLITC